MANPAHDPIETSRVPVPDPTVLTTKLTEREIAALREFLEGKLEGLQQLVQEQISGRQAILETRFNEMDKAITLVRDEHRRFLDQVALYEARTPQMVDEKVSAAGAVVDEKFRSIATQFLERDIRTEQTSRDSKVAVDAALQAAKEAVNAQQIANSVSNEKMERGITKQIDQINLTMQTSNKALEDKIGTGNAEWTRSTATIEARMNRMEGAGLGKQQQLGQWIAIGGLMVAIAVLIAKFI